MLQNVNTPYPLIYTGVFLGVTGVNFLENIVYISNERFRNKFLHRLHAGKVNKQKKDYTFC